MGRPIWVLSLAVVLLAAAAVAPGPTSAGLLPVAVNDTYSAVHGKLRTVAGPGVLSNDLQLGGGFTARLVNDVDHGTLDLNGNGSFTYTSSASYVGADTFRYRVDGGLLGLSNTATVTINVTNDAPVARPDAYSAVADVEKSIVAPGVLGNDDDADGDDMAIDVVQEPAHGNLNEDDDGSFRYKADDGFGGTDTWRYRVSDGLAWSNTVTVTMTVTVPATPKPTPAPTPAPTPQPTPRPTPRPTPTPTPRPTIGPVVTLPPLPPLPSIGPLPSLLPQPSPTQSPRPTSSPTTRPSTTPSATPTAASSARVSGSPGGPTGPGGRITSPTPRASEGSTTAPAPSTATEPPFTLPSVDDGGQLELDTGRLTFDSFEWAVPALVLTVPGILIVIAVLVQTLIGLAWLPVARRWLEGDRRRRRVPSPARARV
jgi:Bacterial Ig domain